MIIFRIKEIRKEKNISMYALSKKTKISRSYLLELENSTKINPSISILYNISVALDVNIKDLFYTTMDIYDLKEEMYKSIDETSLNSKKTLEISNLIDLLINLELFE